MHPTPPQRSPLIRKRRWHPKPKPREETDYAAIAARDKGCVAPRLGGSSLDCWGRDRFEHIKVEPRMGKRGVLVVVLCQGHTEDGMRAGYVWCTDAKNRQACRDYALSFDA